MKTPMDDLRIDPNILFQRNIEKQKEARAICRRLDRVKHSDDMIQ